MPKWEKFLDEEEGTPQFEKFDKNLKNGRRLLKLSDAEIAEKKQKEKEEDEKRASKRRDEV